jgi:hypothetical protein
MRRAVTNSSTLDQPTAALKHCRIQKALLGSETTTVNEFGKSLAPLGITEHEERGIGPEGELTAR